MISDKMTEGLPDMDALFVTSLDALEERLNGIRTGKKVLIQQNDYMLIFRNPGGEYNLSARDPENTQGPHHATDKFWITNQVFSYYIIDNRGLRHYPAAEPMEFDMGDRPFIVLEGERKIRKFFDNDPFNRYREVVYEALEGLG